MSRNATTKRTAKEDGLRNHRMDPDTLIGTRRWIISKYRLSWIAVMRPLERSISDNAAKLQRFE
jgi:hypothetical protein